MPDVVRINWRPLHAGQRAIKNALGQRNVLRCGRRFGKTELLETVFGRRAALADRRVGWFTPDYKLMRPSYKRLHDTLGGLVQQSSKTESIIEFLGGGGIEFWTLDNEDAGRSRFYDDVVVDEASLKLKGLRQIVEQAIMPTLLDRGGTLTLAGTPKGIDEENYFYVACNDKTLRYQEFYAPTWDNPVIPLRRPGESEAEYQLRRAEDLENLKRNNAPLVYQQEYAAQFVDWSGVAFFSLDKLLVEGAPVAYPPFCDAIFAVIDSATKTGKDNDGTGVIYVAYSRLNYGHPPLVILDWDIQQIEGASLESWLPSVFERCEELARECKSRNGSTGTWIEDKASGMVLLQQAARRGWPARAIDSKLTSLGKSERAINVSGSVFSNKIKFSQHAYDKQVVYKQSSKNHLLNQLVSFRVGETNQKDDDLLDCFCYAGALALGNAEGF